MSTVCNVRVMSTAEAAAGAESPAPGDMHENVMFALLHPGSISHLVVHCYMVVSPPKNSKHDIHKVK